MTCLCGMFLPSSRALAGSDGLLVKWQKRKLSESLHLASPPRNIAGCGEGFLEFL